jgi:hypothetical protein
MEGILKFTRMEGASRAEGEKALSLKKDSQIFVKESRSTYAVNRNL